MQSPRGPRRDGASQGLYICAQAEEPGEGQTDALEAKRKKDGRRQIKYSRLSCSQRQFSSSSGTKTPREQPCADEEPVGSQAARSSLWRTPGRPQCGQPVARLGGLAPQSRSRAAMSTGWAAGTAMARGPIAAKPIFIHPQASRSWWAWCRCPPRRGQRSGGTPARFWRSPDAPMLRAGVVVWEPRTHEPGGRLGGSRG